MTLSRQDGALSLQLVGLCGLKVREVDRLRLIELLLALQCHLRVGELRLRGIEISLRFLQCCLDRARDRSERSRSPFLTIAPSVDCITKKDAFDLCLQGDVGNRHNVAKSVNRQRHALRPRPQQTLPAEEELAASAS